MKYRFLVFIGMVVPAFAAADYISGAVGHTTFGMAGNPRPGIGNFGTLDTRGGSYGDNWATGLKDFDSRFVPGEDTIGRISPRLDYRARYLYLYQLINNDKTQSMREFRVVIAASHVPLVTSWGYFQDTGFADDKKMTGTVVPCSVTSFLGSHDETAPPGTGVFKVINPRVVVINQEDPGLNPSNVYYFGRAVVGSFVGHAGFLPPLRRGTVFGYTSDYPPTLVPGSVTYHCGGPNQPPCPKP